MPLGKKCSKCTQVKALTDFYGLGGGRQGVMSECKECVKARQKLANARNAARPDTEVSIPAESFCTGCRRTLPGTAFTRNRTRKSGIQSMCYACHRDRRYGLEPGQWDRLMIEQDGSCAICRRPCSRGGELSVDHHHGTGAVRGLLCQNCNAGIGMFGDSMALLQAAAKYLNRH